MSYGLRPHRRWTADEDRRLRELAGRQSVRSAAAALGRSQDATLGRWRRLRGLDRRDAGHPLSHVEGPALSHVEGD